MCMQMRSHRLGEYHGRRLQIYAKDELRYAKARGPQALGNLPVIILGSNSQAGPFWSHRVSGRASIISDFIRPDRFDLRPGGLSSLDQIQLLSDPLFRLGAMFGIMTRENSDFLVDLCKSVSVQ